MGNFSNGVKSESANVGAKWPERKSLADVQSLKARPPLRSGFCSCGMAKAPSITTGVSFNNSRLLMVLNLRLSVCEFIRCIPCGRHEGLDEIRESEKSRNSARSIAEAASPGNR